ncbi:NADH:ubiquinone reductase (Na(+)-transporting) subunit B [Flammeovirgaceae bacterium SG7u.111]|nr:NADH:ubiquinone reductase (Na(+)-transporting) subunit B [Flammeovirgaceae bacterium SG7u.132]WPO38706.1 NADH:ubiquinone reductase (Na(+)-transporting) subunit B [Flammeovirgaceae bacterium SG7u.111]
MKFLEDLLNKQKPMFEKGGKLEKLHYLFEAGETFLFTPPTVAGKKGAQIRDAIDLKRLMITVVVALVPCLLFGIYNVGYQHYLALGQADASAVDMMTVGLIQVIPIILVSYTAGGLVEVAFGLIRKHPINEGFLVTGLLIPLIVPATIPLWQVALAAIFAVVIGKEVFGGTGMNILNVAMTARAFLYFAYPTEISGEIWTYLGDASTVEGFSGATFLGLAATASSEGIPVAQAVTEATSSWAAGMYDLPNLFMGFIPGSIGETSVLMCLIGAAVLVLTRVASGRVIFSVFVGAYLMGLLFNLISANEFMKIPAHYHLVIGGLAFGAVFMATDPVTCTQTATGKWIYGIMIGMLTVIIRVFNPAYPEGIMLAVLLMNVFAPLIDFYVIQANKKRRLQRATV